MRWASPFMWNEADIFSLSGTFWVLLSVFGNEVRGLRPGSSAGQSTALLRRGSWVRLPAGSLAVMRGGGAGKGQRV